MYTYYVYICMQNVSIHLICWLGSCIVANRNHNSFRKWLFPFSLITRYSKVCSGQYYFNCSVKPSRTQSVSNFTTISLACWIFPLSISLCSLWSEYQVYERAEGPWKSQRGIPSLAKIDWMRKVVISDINSSSMNKKTLLLC